MARPYVVGGPKRFRHQVQGLRKMIETRGVCGLLFDPGCLSGDTVVTVNRGGKSFPISLRDLEHRFNGGVVSGHTWREDIQTRIQRNVDGTSRLAQVVRVASAGVQQTYTLQTEDGRSIRATGDHPFETPQGLRRLDELAPGDEVLVNVGRSQSGRKVKQRYRERAGLRHHPYAYKRKARTSPYRVAEHRLVVEADMNGLALADYCQRLRAGAVVGMQFLDPEVHVHHIDLDPVNNLRSNLQVMDASEHHRLHARMSKGRHVLEQVGPVAVREVIPWGSEEVFDVTVADDPHTFLAETFSVGNTGKTAVALDYAGLLALKSPTGEARVLVVAPLVAVDTWVSQAATYLTPDVDYWAEAVGGGLLQRAETLAARGGNPYTHPLGQPRSIPAAPRPLGEGAGTFEREAHAKAQRVHDTARRAHQRFQREARKGAPHHRKAIALGARRRDGQRVDYSRGPSQLSYPRLIIEVVNIDTFASRSEVGSKTMADVMLDAVHRYSPDLVIVDESHKIKGPSANASRLLARIARSVPRRVILTGTVMPHSPMDVFAQWRFLDPHAFGDGSREATFGGFKNRYAIMGGWMGKEVKGYHRLDEMQDIMARNSIVARKEDALDLPPTQDVVIPVHLSAGEKRAYEDLRSDLATQLADGSLVSTPNRLVQMMRLRQVTSGHLPDDDTGTVQVIGKSKVQTIASLVNDTLAGEKRVVVFALFSKEIEMLSEALATSGTEVMAVTGHTPVSEREGLRRRFGSKDPQRMVMIAQIKTMSLAVNELVTASHAVFASLSQQRDDMVQARDRLNRIGQERPVTFWYALAPGTVDAVIMRSHRDRTDLESACLAHIQNQGEGIAR